MEVVLDGPMWFSSQCDLHSKRGRSDPPAAPTYTHIIISFMMKCLEQLVECTRCVTCLICQVCTEMSCFLRALIIILSCDIPWWQRAISDQGSPGGSWTGPGGLIWPWPCPRPRAWALTLRFSVHTNARGRLWAGSAAAMSGCGASRGR